MHAHAASPNPIDALAIARAALREPDLPAAVHDATSRELKLLVDHREDLLGERTRMINRLRWHLHELDPELELPARSHCSCAPRRPCRAAPGPTPSRRIGDEILDPQCSDHAST